MPKTFVLGIFRFIIMLLGIYTYSRFMIRFLYIKYLITIILTFDIGQFYFL